MVVEMTGGKGDKGLKRKSVLPDSTRVWQAIYSEARIQKAEGKRSPSNVQRVQQKHAFISEGNLADVSEISRSCLTAADAEGRKKFSRLTQGRMSRLQDGDQWSEGERSTFNMQRVTSLVTRHRSCLVQEPARVLPGATYQAEVFPLPSGHRRRGRSRPERRNERQEPRV